MENYKEFTNAARNIGGETLIFKDKNPDMGGGGVGWQWGHGLTP